jgi:glycosyltransferase involved in cell wall biosynthesis
VSETTSTSRRPTVAVIIPVYNGAQEIAGAIRSALEQTVPPDEVLVVDDGSTDHTADVVRGYPVTLIQQRNAGPGAARNRGAEASRSEWLAFLDHDDRWHPEKTARQLSCAAAGGDQIGVVYSCHAQRDEVPFSWDALWNRNIVGTPTGVLVRRRCFLEAGGFDERRALIGTEDHHLWLRIAAMGTWDFRHCPGRWYDYLPAQGSLSRQFARMAAAEKLSYTEIAARVGLSSAALQQKIADVNNHYLREFIGIRDFASSRRLIREMKLNEVAPDLLVAAFCPSWVFAFRRSLRGRLSAAARSHA